MLVEAGEIPFATAFGFGRLGDFDLLCDFDLDLVLVEAGEVPIATALGFGRLEANLFFFLSLFLDSEFSLEKFDNISIRPL